MESLSQQIQNRLGRWVFVAYWFASSQRIVGLALLCVHAIAVIGQAQILRTDDFQHLPPGAIGHRQLLRSDPLREYYSQPVQITAPGGALIASYGKSEHNSVYGQLDVALLVEKIYRFHVSEITNLGNVVLYPSVEVIDRLYPPAGRAHEFPIPVELSAEDLRLAAQGKYVTRVIYVEDPDDTFPYNEADIAEDSLRSNRNMAQRYFEVPPGEDPYIVARGLGRPVAILRIGNRAPTRNADDGEFTFNSNVGQPLPPPQRFAREGSLSTSRAAFAEPSSSVVLESVTSPTKTKPARKSFVSRVSGFLPIRK